MYTIVLKKIIAWGKKHAGHCDDGGGSGHCS